jgi:hypothetical protein
MAMAIEQLVDLKNMTIEELYGVLQPLPFPLVQCDCALGFLVGRDGARKS